MEVLYYSISGSEKADSRPIRAIITKEGRTHLTLPVITYVFHQLTINDANAGARPNSLSVNPPWLAASAELLSSETSRTHHHH
jgi:hypothetical protein